MPGRADRVRERVNAYRKGHAEIVREQERARAKMKPLHRTRATNAARQLMPQPCEKCGMEPRKVDGRRIVHAHHDDYSKPLEVRWLCRTCHAMEHREVA